MNWIKYSTNLHDKPRVQRIADELGISRFDAAGRLCAVWVWADTMTDNGRIAFGSLKQVDRAAELDGFGKAMQTVGWLEMDGEELVIPGWEDHHSKSAKRRADGAKRASKNRQSAGNSAKRAQRAHENATKCAPREEKNREEKSAEAIASASPTPPAEAAAYPIPRDGVRPEGGGELLHGGDATQHLGDFARSVGWVQHEWRDLEILRQTAWSIELGDYPEISDAAARGDPLAYLRPRLSRYWADRKAEREENPSLKVPSLRKTLEEGRWRIDPTVSNARVSTPQTPKHISPERARALDRLTRRNAS